MKYTLKQLEKELRNPQCIYEEDAWETVIDEIKTLKRYLIVMWFIVAGMLGVIISLIE